MKTSSWQKLGLGALAVVGGVLLLGAKPARGHGTIVWQGGSYTPTMEEWLWLARACYGESRSLEGRTAAAWAMVQRFAARRQRGVRQTLGESVRGFSVMVSELWDDNAKCLNGSGCCGNCTQEQLDRRAFVRSRSWDWLREREPDLYFMVLSFSAGLPPSNPVPGLTNFADCEWEGHSCHTEQVGSNCFCADPPLAGVATVVQAQ